jgi:hypothetical protein
MYHKITNKILFIVLFLILNLIAFGQKTEYYRILQKAEQKIIDSQLDSALIYYNKAFVKYNYPFVRDISAAACISFHTEDTISQHRYVEILLNKGMDIRELEYFIRQKPMDEILLAFKENYQKYNRKYLASIDCQMEEKFGEIDKQEQIINWNKNLTIEQKINKMSTLSQQFIGLVEEYGYPSQKKVGIGCSSAITFTNNNSLVAKPNIKSEIIKIPGFRGKSFKKYAFWEMNYNFRYLFHQTTRVGNGYLWHSILDRFPKLDSILLQATRNLELSPTFYASTKERGGKEDFALAWESKTLWKYKFDLKKIVISSEAIEINRKRKKIGIRSLEMDLALFNAIAKLENLKYKNHFKRKAHPTNLLFNSLFISIIP